MKAAVCYEFGKPLVIEDITVDPPQAGEVKVQLAATAVCHSDIHLVRGDWFGQRPVIPGHEAAGVVEAVGDQVSTVQPGDHVVVSLLKSCGYCAPCVTGAPHMCEGIFPLDTERRLRNQRGEPVHPAFGVGAFAESAIVRESQLVLVPDTLPLDRACLLACGVITGVGAVLNTASVGPGDSVAVIGVGGVGLNAIQGAAISGAYPIIAVDLLDSKLEAAKAFGATHAVSAGESAAEAVKQLTGGRGVDFAFVTVGSVEATNQAFWMIGRQGSVVLVGIPEARATAQLPLAYWVTGERKVIGSMMGSSRLSVDVPRLVELYERGVLKLDELISARYTLAEIHEAIRATETGQALRNVVMLAP